MGFVTHGFPTIGTIVKASPAEKAGLKPGDTIVEVEGKPVVSMAQIQHILGPKYEGDKISLKYKRGDKTLEVKSLELVGKNVTIAQGYLGILPMRDDPALGGPRNEDYGIWLFQVDPRSGRLTPSNADGSAWVSFTNVRKKTTTGLAGPHMVVFDPSIPVEPGQH